MNNRYIWLASLNAMQIKVSSAIAYHFNQLIYATPNQPTGRQMSRQALYLPQNSQKWQKWPFWDLIFFGSEQNLDIDQTLV